MSGACFTSFSRRIVADRHIELLHGFHRGIEHERRHAQRQILHRPAVDHVVLVVAAAARDRKGDAGSRPVRHHEAAQPGKLRAPSIDQRHIHDGLVFDDVRNRGGLRLQQWDTGFYVDRLRNGAHRKGYIHRADHSGFDLNTRAVLCLEPVLLDFQIVGSWQQERKREVAFRARSLVPGIPRFDTLEGHLRPGYGRLGGVHNSA